MIFNQRTLCCSDAHTEALHITQNLHGFGDMRIPIVSDARPSKVFGSNNTERSSRAVDFDAVVKPNEPDRRVGVFRTSDA